MDSHAPSLVFNMLAATGLFLLSVTAIPAAFCSQVHRSTMWFSMIISWVVYSASYMLLLGHQYGPEPPRGICGLQMLFIYASPPLTATTGLTFLVDVYLRIKKGLFTGSGDHKYTRALLLIPWAIFAAVAAEALIIITDFDEIQREPNHMYCHSVVSTQASISATICVVSLSAALIIEACIIATLYRNWALFRQRKSRMGGDLRLSSLLRILVFTLQTSIGLGLGALGGTITSKNTAAIWSAMLPLLPVICGITFGSQADIISAWMFWKPCEEAPVPANSQTRTSRKDGTEVHISA